jgi:RNA polymerase sigma-70 factor, ECF subfamily
MSVRDPIGDLYQRVGGTAYRLARAIVVEPAAAEDVVQEAFVRLLRRRDGLRDGHALDAYVTRAVRNLAYNHLRRRRTIAAAQPLLEASAELLVEPTEPGGAEQAAALDRALRTLPAEQREVLHLRVFEGLEGKEVARRTGVPLGTVHSRYRYALSKLREQMQAGEDRHDG